MVWCEKGTKPRRGGLSSPEEVLVGRLSILWSAGVYLLAGIP
jgi:hypothetical protein